MSVVGLSVYEYYAQNGDILVAREGELDEQLSSGLATGTSYFLPQGGNWLDARPWGDKTFLIQADQAMAVDVLDSEDGGVTFQTVQGMSIAPASFQAGRWNSVETTLGLNLVQLRATTQGAAPSKITLQVRFVKQG